MCLVHLCVSQFLVPDNTDQSVRTAWLNEWISWLLSQCWYENSIKVPRTNTPIFILELIPQSIFRIIFCSTPRPSFIHPYFFHSFGTLTRQRVLRECHLLFQEKCFLGLSWILQGCLLKSYKMLWQQIPDLQSTSYSTQYTYMWQLSFKLSCFHIFLRNPC